MKFLIVRLGSLGDVVHAIPAAAALRRAHPDAGIDWVVDPRYVELLQIVSGLDRIVPLDPRAGAGALLGAIRTLRRERYEAALDLQGLIKSAVLTRAVGARRAIGFPKAHLREPLAAVFYGEQPDPGPDPHVIHKGLALVRAVGVTDVRVEFPLRVPETETARFAASHAGPGGYAIVNPGAAWPNKRWPPDRFGAVAASLRDRFGLTSIVLWGPDEGPLADGVVASSRGAAVRAPGTTIVDIASVARGARLMVSGDTGPLHIGAAVGAPIVALFGPTRVERNGPWVREDLTITQFARCECHYERRCRRRMPCIEDIGVDDVIAACERRLARAAPKRDANLTERGGGRG